VDVGQRTEAIVIAELTRRGYRVLLPFGHNHRYDLVVDVGDRFLRVQCKTARLVDGTVRFNTVSVRCNMNEIVRRDYAGDIDVFAAYCPQNGRTYIVPVAEAAGGVATLRITPPANGQRKGVRWAAAYELPEPETGLEPVTPALQGQCSTS
jgi:hypothetical protein